MDKTETPCCCGEPSTLGVVHRKGLPCFYWQQHVDENADLRRQLAAERGRVVDGAYIARVIFEVGDEPQDKVRRIAFRGGKYPDGETDLGGLNEWALTAVIDRALADPQQSDLPPGYTEIDAYIAEQEKDPARAAALKRAWERAQSAQQNAEGRVCKLSCTENCGSCVAPSAPERDALVKRDGRAPTRRTLQTHAAKMLWLAQNTDRRCGGDRRFESNGGRVRLGINGLLDAKSALSPAGVVVPDKGPWTVAPDGHAIYSDDFDHDVHLSVHGDFADDTERKKYSDGIAALLTAAAKETK